MQTMTPDAQPAAVEQAPPTLLLVDDEASILSALKRLFRAPRYRILTADSGQAGLDTLARERVDLVISDMRMPNMDGAEFLGKVRAGWPEVVRVILTGYADVASTVAAINHGEIYRYISKPWEDNDVLLLVRHALERKQLGEEKQRLEALTAKQNDELRDLNANLDAKVKQRTEELRTALKSLETAHEKLKVGFLTSIQVFGNITELRAGVMAGHGRRVANNARRIAVKIGMPTAASQDVFLAALLHDLGKFGLPDSVLNKPVPSLSNEERAQVQMHPVKGETALMPLEQMRGAALLIRAHHERYDGLGYPDGLSGVNIPLGARVLMVANEYDGLLEGTLLGKRLSSADALRVLVQGKGKRYDPDVVDSFVELAKGDTAGHVDDAVVQVSRTSHVATNDSPVTVAHLQEGMVLARDVYTADGLLLIARDRTLDGQIIRQLQKFLQSDDRELTVHIKTPKH